MVMAPANTGNLVINKAAVIATLQTKSGNRASVKAALTRLTRIVVRKLILPRIEEMPARCREKMAKSTEMPV